MKPFLALVSGFLLTLVVFASGGAVAAWFLAAEPVQPTGPDLDTAQLWSREPRRVDQAAQDLERVPARVSQPAPSPAAQPAELPLVTAAAASEGPVDATTTGAIEPTAGTADQPPADAEMVAVHLEWCASRYRSYRADDNSYRSYSGRRRVCVSPFLEAAMAPQPEPQARNPLIASADETDSSNQIVSIDEAPSTGMAGPTYEGAPAELLGYASADQEAVSADHVAYCFDRYRSYRPEDNTYQPYGGGPRRQCE